MRDACVMQRHAVRDVNRLWALSDGVRDRPSVRVRAQRFRHATSSHMMSRMTNQTNNYGLQSFEGVDV